jgi:5-hydroxyisourate hydrolase
MMTTITTTVLDGLHGRPADSIRAVLARASGKTWTTVSRAAATEAGLIDDWGGPVLSRGIYRVTFDSDQYFASQGLLAAYPEVAVTFRLDDGQRRCHVWITLSPHAYSACISIAS